MKPPKDIVHQLLAEDAFSKWLGIELIEIRSVKKLLKF